MNHFVRESATRIRIGTPVPLAWSGLAWHVAIVEHGKDRAAREWLEDCGVPVFAVEGCKAFRRGGSGPWRTREWLVMEGYLFIGELAAAQLAAGRWSSDPRRRGVDCPIVGFLGMQGGAVPVDAFAMQALFAAHDAGTFSSGQPIDGRINPLRIGDEVRILKGPFTYLDAIVLKVLKGDDVEIQLELFGSKRVAKVGLDSLALKP